MNALRNYYQWLTPTVPFEFIKHRSTDECAALLAAQAGARIGPIWGSLKVEIAPGLEQKYSFVIKRDMGAFFTEIRGNIIAVANDYSQVEGLVRARATRFGLFVNLLGVGGFCLFAIAILFREVLSEGQPLALIAAIGLVGLLVIFITFVLRAHRWTMRIYADMILGTLMRII